MIKVSIITLFISIFTSNTFAAAYELNDDQLKFYHCMLNHGADLIDQSLLVIKQADKTIVDYQKTVNSSIEIFESIRLYDQTGRVGEGAYVSRDEFESNFDSAQVKYAVLDERTRVYSEMFNELLGCLNR